MFRSLATNPTLLGSLCALAAVFCFSVNDVSIKFLSGGYALHEVVLIRSAIGMTVLFAILVPLTGERAIWRTNRLGIHIIRGLCVVFANMTFFLGLAALPLAEGVALFFVSPLIITVFSVIFLKEFVGPRRWVAVGFGLLGVLIVLRPGSEVFQVAAFLPIAAAFGYAGLHILTRLIGKSESALTMTFYIQITFVVVSSGLGLSFGDGSLAGSENASLAFMFRQWVMPVGLDWIILVLVGTTSALGGFFISQAYRVAEAGVVAPFEYVAMPLAVLWGVMVFDEWPDLIAVLGILLIIGSGLFMIWREAGSRETEVSDTPRYRR